MFETLIGMATIVGLVVGAFLVFEKLTPEKKAGVVGMLISGCIIAAVILLWHPASIGDVPLASLTLSGLAANLGWWLVLIVFVIVFFAGAVSLLS